MSSYRNRPDPSDVIEMNSDGSFEIPSAPVVPTPPPPPPKKAAPPVQAPKPSLATKPQVKAPEPPKVAAKNTAGAPPQPEAAKEGSTPPAAKVETDEEPSYEIYELRPKPDAPPLALDIIFTLKGGDGHKVRVSETELRIETQNPKGEKALTLPHLVDPKSAKVYQDGSKFRLIVDVKQVRESE